MIITNICGSISLTTIRGYQYFITFIYNYSTYGWIQLLTKKFEFLDVFKSFKISIELKLGKKNRCVNSNKGNEYYGKYGEFVRNLDPFAKCLQECDIKASHTMLDTP